MPANRNRNIAINFRVTKEEKEQILKRMQSINMNNQTLYFRKIATQGYIVNIDMSGIKTIVELLRISSNNLNQITKRVNSTNHIYADDLEDLKQNHYKIVDEINKMIHVMNEL